MIGNYKLLSQRQFVT